MAVPKKRTTRSKRNMRRSNQRVENISLSTDVSTGEIHLRHHVTKEGYYKGNLVIKKKLDKNKEQDKME